MLIEKRYNLEFNGYYPDVHKESIPAISGLYFVYRGERTQNGDGKYTANIKELLYIGQSEDVNARLNGEHEHYEDWNAELEKGETLYYSVCEVPIGSLDEVENACIYKAQPPINTQGKETYNYSPVRVISKGRVSKFDMDFHLR